MENKNYEELNNEETVEKVEGEVVTDEKFMDKVKSFGSKAMKVTVKVGKVIAPYAAGAAGAIGTMILLDKLGITSGDSTKAITENLANGDVAETVETVVEETTK